MKVPSFLKKQTVTQAALLIAITLFFSKFIGFAREILVAKYFGATGITDAFLVAQMIPLSILGLFASGLSTLIIPVYIERKAIDKEAARKFVNSVFVVAALVFLVVSALVIIFAPLCVRVIAYGFKGEQFASAVTLTRYLALSGIFSVLTGLLTGLLQAEKQFLAPAVAGLVGNVVLVLCLFLLTGRLGINGWTVGQNALAVVNFILLFVLLFRRYGLFHSLDWRGIDWKEIGKFTYLLVPLVAASGVGLMNAIVDKTIGSSLDAGSISALNFSARVWGIPVSLLATPIAMAVFPTFSELAVSHEGRAEYSDKLTRTLSISWFFIIPSSVFLFFLSTPIVQLLFERGAFNPAATSLTATVTGMYSFGLFAQAASPILGRAFYSFKNTMTPLLISLGTVVMNIILNILLARIMGAPGIALATSIVMVLNFLFFSLFLKKYFPVLTRPLGIESLKMIAASVPIAVICLLSRPFFHGANAASFPGFAALLFRLGLVGLTGLAAFVAVCHFLKVPSLAFAAKFFRQVLSRFVKRPPTEA